MAYWGTPSHHNPRKQIGGQPPIVPYGEDEDTPAALRRSIALPHAARAAQILLSPPCTAEHGIVCA